MNSLIIFTCVWTFSEFSEFVENVNRENTRKIKMKPLNKVGEIIVMTSEKRTCCVLAKCHLVPLQSNKEMLPTHKKQSRSINIINYKLININNR